MSDTHVPTDDSTDEGDVNIKALREKAKAGDAAAAERDQLRKELLFAKAGVDTESKLGSMLFKTFEGDDVEALKAEWSELAPTPSSEPTPDPGDSKGLEQQQQIREDLTSTGTPSGDEPPETKHPYDVAYEKFHDRESGMPMAQRQEQALAHVLESFVKGDTRVMFDRNDWAQQQEMYGDD